MINMIDDSCVQTTDKKIKMLSASVNQGSLKRPSHVKLMLANSCWQTQIGGCERHNNRLANCWRE